MRDGLQTRCSDQVHGQHLEKSPGATVCETRLRGSSVASSVASEQRSRSSSLNSTDSGSGLLLLGLQAAPELDQGSQPSSQRFSVISSEDFDQELIVKPIKVKKRRRRRKTGTVCGRTHVAPRAEPLGMCTSTWLLLLEKWVFATPGQSGHFTH